MYMKYYLNVSPISEQGQLNPHKIFSTEQSDYTDWQQHFEMMIAEVKHKSDLTVFEQQRTVAS